MADSTHKHSHAGLARAWSNLALTLIAAACAGALIQPSPAAADGDPASDVLAGQSLFLPADGGITPRQQEELSGLVAEANRAGVSVRVAVIASATDLGSVTALWRQPELYARFLDQELSLVFRGRLLVVMPNGTGMAGGGQAPAAGPGLARGQPVPGPALGRLAIDDVTRLAAADGHALAVAVPAPPSSGSTGLGPLLALAAGLILVAGCWGASLRARPLRLGRADP